VAVSTFLAFAQVWFALLVSLISRFLVERGLVPGAGALSLSLFFFFFVSWLCREQSAITVGWGGKAPGVVDHTR